MPSPSFTDRLHAWRAGDEAARNALIHDVYAELRRRAAAYLRRERPGHTLQPTALVHETYLRMAAQQAVPWHDRVHFFAVASQQMRRILVDHVRRRRAAKRGGGALAVGLDDGSMAGAGASIDLGDLDGALDELAVLEPRAARVVELRYFGGLGIEEAAEVLDVAPATVKRDWTMARAWLYQRLRR